MWLLLAFLIVPLIEIGLFIKLGGLIGLWPTLGIVVLTAVLGAWLVRSQGRMAMADLRRSFAELDDPAEPLAHAAMILLAGALLLTPGFFTDAVGFALLLPSVRQAVFAHLRHRVLMQRFEMGPQDRPSDPTRPHPPDIIEGEATEVERPETPPHEGSGRTRH